VPVEEPALRHINSHLKGPCEQVISVLRSIAAGEAIDERIRRLAAVHTRRLRVLFDQAALFEHPLLDELRDAIDAAEARGVDVTIHIGERLPCPQPADTTALGAPLAALLARARGTARISITAPAGAIVASIVCQTEPGDITARNCTITVDGAQIETIALDDTVWSTVRMSAKMVVRHGN
jgi:hypothetical protein